MPKKTRDAKGPTEIFQPKHPSDIAFALPKGIKPSRKLNPSQMDALDSAAANTLTLIQGPPGAKQNIDLKILLRVKKRLAFFFPCSACDIFGIVIF